ncbi:MAG: DUF4248 domain-containing protein [Tannerellaceae bacterium]|nr:DUF4248 domain-containing protein [Tannerellaceae bacterium]
MTKYPEITPRATSFTELALRYNPNMSIKSARRILREWVNINIPLQHELSQTGYTHNLRILSPFQVSLFFKYLGEP